MPADLVKRIDLDLLYPPFLEKALDVLAECRRRGKDYFGIEGYRTPKRSGELFAQGRTAPGRIVSGAKPFFSAHNYGLALDAAKDADAKKEGLQPDWAPEEYDLLGEVAEAHGLVWGGRFKRPDRDHIQWPGYVTAEQMQPLRVIALSQKDPSDLARLQRVWVALA